MTCPPDSDSETAPGGDPGSASQRPRQRPLQRLPVGRRPVLGLLGSLLASCLLPAAALAGPAPATPGFDETAVGYILFDPVGGQVVDARAADTLFIPASVAKIPTVAAALALLGPDHRFTTRLLGSAAPLDGMLRGDLILQGGGDPALATEGLAQLVDMLRAAGLRQVEGRFLYDCGQLPELAEIDAGQPWAAAYNTGIGALSLNYNRALLAWRRGADGRPVPEVLSVASAGRMPLDSVAALPMTAGGPFALLPDGADRWRVALPGGADPRPVWVPVARPGLAAATLFRRMAADAGLSLPPPLAGRAPGNAVPLAALDSLPLSELARGLLRHSNNLSAEVIGLAAARRLDPAIATATATGSGPATLERSAALLQGWLTRQPLEGANWRRLRLANHSGLGTGSRATPRQMAALLRAGGPALWDLLPGEEDGKQLPPGVRAKSGTLAYVKGLSGLLTAASGRRLGFVLFISDPGRRAALDAALDRRVTATPPEARAWAAGARALQTRVLERWIATY
ncbi:D-alanyl-D-alanine carboxypeptidase [Azospirillum sp. HJ39]|uniref:D-alanyl-D-alanine carboxypeptidase/D-alanyl-D-alanine-endopeptidase n=1 Tax=Azospirillum sp. HJ39 TaxID=3159496 RepID=UPI0035568CC6